MKTERPPFRPINPAAPTPAAASRSTKPSTGSGSTSHGRSEWQTISPPLTSSPPPPPRLGEPLLTPAEVAGIFRVHVNTVKRWVGDGKLHPVWTPGGHRRFREAEVDWLYTMTPREAQQ